LIATDLIDLTVAVALLLINMYMFAMEFLFETAVPFSNRVITIFLLTGCVNVGFSGKLQTMIEPEAENLPSIEHDRSRLATIKK
jgi:hypothetical protein